MFQVCGLLRFVSALARAIPVRVNSGYAEARFPNLELAESNLIAPPSAPIRARLIPALSFDPIPVFRPHEIVDKSSICG